MVCFKSNPAKMRKKNKNKTSLQIRYEREKEKKSIKTFKKKVLTEDTPRRRRVEFERKRWTGIISMEIDRKKGASTKFGKGRTSS
jgi:hypothetical protein